jgi:hypothetical protein
LNPYTIYKIVTSGIRGLDLDLELMKTRSSTMSDEAQQWKVLRDRMTLMQAAIVTRTDLQAAMQLAMKQSQSEMLKQFQELLNALIGTQMDSMIQVSIMEPMDIVFVEDLHTINVTAQGMGFIPGRLG